MEEGWREMEASTCIFKLSKIMFSGSSLGGFYSRDGEAANKGIKGRSRIPPAQSSYCNMGSG